MSKLVLRLERDDVIRMTHAIEVAIAAETSDMERIALEYVRDVCEACVDLHDTFTEVGVGSETR